MISKYRPQAPIIAVTTQERTVRRLALIWGVHAVQGRPVVDTTDKLIENALEGGHKSGLVKEGDLVVITAGIPLGASGSTNLIKISCVPAQA